MVGLSGLLGAVTLAACSGPVPVQSPNPSDSAAARCADLLAALPDEVDGLPAREVEPADALAAAWGDPAVVLRCGVERPAALTPSSSVYTIDSVTWFPEELTAGYLFTTYDRSVYVEVTVPDDYAPEADVLVALDDAIAATIPPTERTAAGE
jgi:hypothetical protein